MVPYNIISYGDSDYSPSDSKRGAYSYPQYGGNDCQKDPGVVAHQVVEYGNEDGPCKSDKNTHHTGSRNNDFLDDPFENVQADGWAVTSVTTSIVDVVVVKDSVTDEVRVAQRILRCCCRVRILHISRFDHFGWFHWKN